MSLTPTEKSLIRDLTIEYVKQNKLLYCRREDINEKISYIAEISAIITAAVTQKNKDFSFL